MMRELRNFFGRTIGLISIPILMISIPFFCIGAYEGWEVWDHNNTYTLAAGTVVDNAYISHTDPEDSARVDYAYHPVVTFHTGTGKTETFTDGVGALPPKYDEGDIIQVLYNPENPDEAQIKSWEMWFPPILFMFIGVLPVLILLVIQTISYFRIEKERKLRLRGY